MFPGRERWKMMFGTGPSSPVTPLLCFSPAAQAPPTEAQSTNQQRAVAQTLVRVSQRPCAYGSRGGLCFVGYIGSPSADFYTYSRLETTGSGWTQVL